MTAQERSAIVAARIARRRIRRLGMSRRRHQQMREEIHRARLERED